MNFQIKITIAFLIFSSSFLSAQDDLFITVWDTSYDGGECKNCVKIGVNHFLEYEYDIDWENDGEFDEFGLTGNAFHDYEVEGIYEVAIRGKFPQLKMYGNPYYYSNFTNDRLRIVDIKQWGDISWLDFSDSFAYCPNLNISAVDAPDLSLVENMNYAFAGCNSLSSDLNHWDVSNIKSMQRTFLRIDNFNADISNWDVSNVEDMRYMFSRTEQINCDLGNWDVSNVTNMHSMFKQATEFNQDLNNWDVSNVEVMEDMFYRAISFNQNIGDWDVSNVTNMHGMFELAFSFNIDISRWDVSSVENMSSMFFSARSFNQEIGEWDVFNVTTMERMFEDANEFNGDLSQWRFPKTVSLARMFEGTRYFNSDISQWDVSNVKNLRDMFCNADRFNQYLGDWNISTDITDLGNFLAYSGMSRSNYEETLNGWAVNPNTPDSISMDASKMVYCDQSGRNLLLDKGWTILDDDHSSSPNCITNNEETQIDDIKIYPNPVFDVLFIESEDLLPNNNFQILNELGQVVVSGNIDFSGININELSEGVYFIKITDGSIFQKFVKL